MESYIDIEVLLEKIRLNCVVMNKHHKKRYLYLKGILRYANVGIGASPTTKLDVIDDGAVMFASSSSVHSSIKSVAGAKLILNNRSLNDDSPSTDEID